MKKAISILVLVIFVLIGFTGCAKKESPKSEPAPPPLTKVTVMLDYTPNTNHTGLYVAQEKGYYREHGLEVEILQMGDPGPAQLIAAGKVDFGVSFQEQVTYARTENMPIVSVAAIIQHNTSAFASLQKDSITRPKDLEGKRYGGWGTPEEQAVIEAIMTRDGANPKKVKQIDIGETDLLMSLGKNFDFTWIFHGWQGIEAQLRNIPLNVMMLKDFDPALDYYTPVLITSEKTIQEKPETVKKFLAATSKGYEFCIAQPEEAGNILIKSVPEINKELVLASQKWLKDQYRADASRWGWQKKEVWHNYASWMHERKLLKTMIDTEKAYTNQFLPQ